MEQQNVLAMIGIKFTHKSFSIMLLFSVDGEWSLWSGWTECNVTCGGGLSGRFRFCSESLNGGSNCTGEAKQYMACNEQECPSKYQPFVF